MRSARAIVMAMGMQSAIRANSAALAFSVASTVFVPVMSRPTDWYSTRRPVSSNSARSVHSSQISRPSEATKDIS